MSIASLTIIAGLVAKLVAVNRYNLNTWHVLVLIIAIDLVVAGTYHLVRGH